MISDKAIKLIEAIIEKYGTAITIRYAGAGDHSAEVIQQLIKEGILGQEDIQDEGIISEAYLLGKIRASQTPEEREKLTTRQFAQKYKKEISTLSDSQRKSLENIKQMAKTQLDSLKAESISNIKSTLLNTNWEVSKEHLGQEVGTAVKEAYLENKTLGKLVSDLQKNAQDYSSKWNRIATTELTRAINTASADSMIERSKGKTNDEIYCYFLVVHDARLCRHCSRLYLTEANTPKVFTMAELIANGSNYGKKAADWKPSLAGMHPNCRCQVVQLSENWGFLPGSDRAVYIEMGHNEYKKQNP